MEWSTIDTQQLLRAIRQAQHAKRPWREFFKKFSAPKDSNRAVSRLKCNLYYYRVNYAQVFTGVTGVCIVRNPSGAVSLALMATGAALYIDSIASTASSKIMLLLGKFDSSLAARIRSAPGGHDGQSVPPGKEPLIKIAGYNRNTIANALIGIGGITAMFTGAINTLIMGAAAGSVAVLAHAVLRPPNMQARIQNFKRNVDDMVEEIQ
eukprot:jgi/Ulvmu1/7603/UM038_0028.1